MILSEQRRSGIQVTDFSEFGVWPLDLTIYSMYSGKSLNHLIPMKNTLFV